MLELITDTWQDAHPIITHFPIALLVIAVPLGLIARFKPEWLLPSWLLFLLGSLFTIPSTITGLISHSPYEATELHDVIERHQLMGMATTLIFVGLLIWRWTARRRGKDNGTTWAFITASFVGLILLTLAGMFGGDLVFDYGVNVRGINPLLP